MGNDTLQELHFSEHAFDSEGSLALFLANGESRCGIYWLHFRDGDSYVGQSVNTKRELNPVSKTQVVC